MEKIKLILTVLPSDVRAAQRLGLPMAHLSYRLGKGAHLFRSQVTTAVRGGYMVIDDTEFEGQGDSSAFCKEVLMECSSRGFQGVVADFQQSPTPFLGEIVSALAGLLTRRGWPLFVPESYGSFSDQATVMISSAISGGSFSQRMQEVIAQYGASRVALEVERVAADFFLPAPSGGGRPLSEEELSALKKQLSPSIFFSNELCSHYFTYMDRESGAHFVLFDDGASMGKKIQIASSLGIQTAFLDYPDAKDWVGELK